MATTSYGVNANEAVKTWSRRLFRESLRATRIFPFIGDTTNSIIQTQDDTSKGPGDRVRLTLRYQISGDGVSGDSTQEGNEESLVTQTDDIVIDQLRHAVRSGGRMSEQRIPFSVRNEARLALQDWWAGRIDTWAVNQLSGAAGVSDIKYTGMQSVTTLDTNHIVRAAAPESLTAGNTMTLSDIDQAVETAISFGNGVGTAGTDVPIRPLKIGGNDYYVLFVHPFQAKDIRTSTNSGQWLDIQKQAMAGGEIAKNPIFTGALGIYNRCILHEWARVVEAPNSSSSVPVANTRRALLCGAQAAGMAFGRENGPTTMTWVEELFDYQNQLGVSAGMIAGLKRSIFNSATFGVIGIDSFAASGTS